VAVAQALGARFLFTTVAGAFVVQLAGVPRIPVRRTW